MANSFEISIQKLKELMGNVNTHEGESGLLGLLKSAKLIDPISNTPFSTLSTELRDILSAVLSQHAYTSSTFGLLNGLSPVTVTLDLLTTAVNLIQLYFQVTQPLDQILSELVDNLNPTLLTNPTNKPITLKDIEGSIKIINQDRTNLRKAQNKVLREFESEIDEKKLQDLLQRSSDILTELQDPNLTNINQLLLDIDDLIRHLQTAQELFKTLRRQGEALRDNEADEVEQLIRNWRDSIKEIERLDQSNAIRKELNQNQESSRQAVAQSIQIHDLLEENYSFLSDLIRSGDLVSSGIL